MTQHVITKDQHTSNREQVVTWGNPRFLKDTTQELQYPKMQEEVLELFASSDELSGLDFRDALGDVLVTIYVYAHLTNNPISATSDTLPQITSPVGHLSLLGLGCCELDQDETSTGLARTAVLDYMILSLQYMAILSGTTLQVCFDDVMTILNKRTGKNVDGVFVKDD